MKNSRNLKFLKKTKEASKCFQAQRIYYFTIAVCFYEYGAEKILNLSNVLHVSCTPMRAAYQNVLTLIKSKLTISCTTASVEHAVYQDGGVTNILAKSLRRRTIELQLL